MRNISKITLAVVLGLALLQSGVSIASKSSKANQETVGQYVDGSVITATVKSKIFADKRLRDTDITVTTSNDVVQLSGFVNTIGQKAHAEKIAKLVDGVKSVDNQLVIE